MQHIGSQASCSNPGHPLIPGNPATREGTSTYPAANARGFNRERPTHCMTKSCALCDLTPFLWPAGDGFKIRPRCASFYSIMGDKTASAGKLTVGDPRPGLVPRGERPGTGTEINNATGPGGQVAQCTLAAHS